METAQEVFDRGSEPEIRAYIENRLIRMCADEIRKVQNEHAEQYAGKTTAEIRQMMDVPASAQTALMSSWGLADVVVVYGVDETRAAVDYLLNMFGKHSKQEASEHGNS